MPLATCPSAADLEAMLHGGVAESVVQDLEQHVLECNACLAKLKALSNSKDTLADDLRHDTHADPVPPVVAELITRLQALQPAKNSPNQGVSMLTLTCSSCQKKLSVKEDLAGKKVKCPGCGAVMTAPMLAPVAANLLDLPSQLPELPKDPTPSNPPTHQPDSTRSNSAEEDDGHESSLTDFLGPKQTDSELGRLGKYRILKILGHGGMGVVYMAEDPKLKRAVAIKAMLPTLAASASAGKRFLREAQAMAAVEHDHIVRIYQVDEDRGVPFLAMEFLKGEPLDARLKNQTRLPVLDVVRIGREIAEALGAAHATGLIHRDIKPANIWLEKRFTAENAESAERIAKKEEDALHSSSAPSAPSAVNSFRVKILDFGLARAASQESGLTQQGAIIGTPAYMAPEQGRGDNVDARCDLFSLGVVLYRLCTGELPFKGKDTVSTLMEVAMHEPPPPAKINSDLPEELSNLVMKLLEKDPAKRPASAAEVVETLGKLEKHLLREQLAEEKTESLKGGVGGQGGSGVRG